MAKYDVTITRTGNITVEANSPEEAMRVANQTAKTNNINWSDDWLATDAEEIPEDDSDPDKPVATLPLQDYNLNIRPIDNGYAIFINNGNTEVRALDITIQNRKICGKTLSSIIASIKRDFHDPDCHWKEELLLPENRPAVVMLKSGRLWCRTCHCYIPNTANNEMKKEGCFAHSHICGIRHKDETYLNEFDADGLPLNEKI